MDKELLRIVIIFIGLIVIAGMLLWGFILDRKTRGKSGFLNKHEPLGRIDPSLVVHTEDDDFDVIPLGSATDKEINEETIALAEAASPEATNDVFNNAEVPIAADDAAKESITKTRHDFPEVLQYGIVAITEHGFSGMDLLAAFQSVGLIYGEMQIFERLDEHNRVNFSVASMIEPGIFPEQDMTTFSCPGIVLFMQPGMVDNPAAVFDDLISVIHHLSSQLKGVEWDNQRQTLTEAAVINMREKLST